MSKRAWADFQDGARSVMLVFLTALLMAGIQFLVTATRVVDGVPALVRSEIDQARDQVIGEVRGARGDAVDQIAKTRWAAVAEIRATRGALIMQTLDARLDLDEKIVAALYLAHAHAGELETRIDDTNKILLGVAHPLAQAAVNVKGITAQVNAAAPLFLDCDHNPDCVFNRWVGVSKGVEQSAIAVGKATPALAADLESIAERADAGLGQFEVRPPWWLRMLGFHPIRQK